MSPATVGSLQDRIKALQSELVHLRDKTNRSTTWTLVLGIVVLALLTGYFVYGYRAFASVMKPEDLVNIAAGMIDEKVPEVRKGLEDEIKKSAPGWAKELCKQAIAGVPDARKELETYILKQADDAFRHANLVSDEHFRHFLTENKDNIRGKIKMLANDQKLSDDALKELEANIEKELQTDLKTQAGDFLAVLSMATAQLKKLREGKKLTREEEDEKRALMIARRLQAESSLDTESAPPVEMRKPAGKPGAAAPKAKDATPSKAEGGKKK